MEVTGKVASGLGEGSKYIKIYKSKIEEKLGITPYDGTLNIKHKSDKLNFEGLKKIKIDKFNGFGEVAFIKCTIKKGEIKTPGYIAIPEKSRHEFIEIISESNLREKMSLSDGDEVKIIIK